MSHFRLYAPDDKAKFVEELFAQMPAFALERCEDDAADDILDDIDRRVATAIRTLQQSGVLRNPADFTWIMVGIGDTGMEGMGAFRSPQSFIDYLHLIGIEQLPSRSTLSAWYNKVVGTYPDWVFTDTDDRGEVLRRKNVFRQFLSIMRRR